MIGVRDLSLVALGLFACPAAWAQTAPDSAPPQPPRVTFRSGVDVVALNVTVLDSTQRLVGDLAQHDFAVFEDGVRQDIAYFETRDIPLDVALLIDTSISMGPSLPNVRKAAAGLVAMLRPLDRAAVFAFNDRVHKLTGFTSDSEVITRAIGETRSNGATALYNAIYVALREFRKSITSDDTVRRRAIVVLSDGEDTASVLSFD